jgi:hypothetical protein
MDDGVLIAVVFAGNHHAEFALSLERMTGTISVRARSKAWF